MSDDDIQKSLALLDACISVLGPSSNRILPWRAFAKPDLRAKIAAFLQEQKYAFVAAKRTYVSPQYKSLAGLKKFLETEYQTTRTIPPLGLVTAETKKERDRAGNVVAKPKRGRPPKQPGLKAPSTSRQKSITRTKRPSTKFTATSVLSPSSKTLYTSDSEHESTRSFTLIKQNFGPMTGNSIDDRYYMGVVRLFGVNLPIPVGTMVWPIEVKMELEEDEDNNNNNEDHNEDKNDSSASYKSQNNSPEMSADFESIEEFSEDLNAVPEDEELLSSGSM